MSSIEALKLGDIMSPRVQTVDPHRPIGEAARLMGEARVSCLVVVDGDQPVGIITEKDLLTLLNRQDDGQAAVNERMSPSLIAATVDTDFHTAYSLLRQHRIRHLVVTDAAGALVGIATATDFRNHLNQEVFSKIERLDAVLDPVVSQLPPDLPLGQAIRHMVTSGWDYVLVVENQRPVGIFTERDIPRLWNADVDMEAVPLRQFMSSPLHCIPVSTQVAEASAAMARWKLRHLPVVDAEGRLLGVVSQNRMLEKLGLALFDDVWRERASLQAQNSDLAARLGLILEGSGVGVWEFDHQTDGVVWSPKFALLCGKPECWAPSGLRGWLDLVHPQDRPHTFQHLRAAQGSAGGELFETEFRLRGADGRWLWLEARGRVLQRDDQGRPLRTAGSLLDISERKHAALLMDAQHRFMQALMTRPGRDVLLRAALDFALSLTDLDGGLVFQSVSEHSLKVLSRRGVSEPFDQEWPQLMAKLRLELLTPGKLYCSCPARDDLCPLASAPHNLCGQADSAWVEIRARDGASAAVLLPLGVAGDPLWEGGLLLVCRHVPRISTHTATALQTLANLFDQALLSLRAQNEAERQHALVHQEKLFSENLINALPGSFYMTDGTDRILRWNQHLKHLTGLSDSDLPRLRSTDLFQATDRPHIAKALADAFAQGGASVEAGMHTATGVTIPVLLTCKRTQIGNQTYLLALGVDVSESKQVRRSLDEERLRLRSLLNTIPDMVWLKDPDGVYLFCNPSCERLMGHPEAAIIGKTDYEFFPRETADFLRSRDLAAVAAGVSVVNEEWLTSATDGHRGIYETVKTPLLNQQGALAGVLGIARDITDRRDAEEAMRRASSVFHNTQEGIIITDAENNIIDVNPAFTQITGYARNEVLGQNPKLLGSGVQGSGFYDEMWRSVLQTGQWRGEICNRRRDGSLYTEMLSIAAVRDSQGQVKEYVGVFSDISRLKEHAAELNRIAHFDPLTGLPNRRLLADRLNHAIAHARRSGKLLAVCYLDLDGFKPVNDRLGHDAGDQILLMLTRNLQVVLRAEDTLARLGGDEFVLLLNDLSREEESSQLLERVLATVSHPLHLDEQVVTLSASVGVTLFPHDNADGDTLLRHADQAMYRAKESGRNRFHLFDPEYDRQAREQRDFLQRVAHGIRHDEFLLHFQPKVNLVTGQVIGVEALIRWRHPADGLLTPTAFLPFLAGTELDGQLGEWVIDTVLKQMEAWKRLGLELAVSANVSAEHLLSPDFIQRLKQALQRHPAIGAHHLELEILETVAISDLEKASAALQAGLDLGVGFALDDFGTGYSSLTYFRRLPVDSLKVDGSFVRDMLDDPDDLSIVESVIHLAEAFNRHVIAEGVETLQHAMLLVKLGCKLGQGYGIAPPMPAEDIPAWMERWMAERPWENLGTSCLPAEDTTLLLAMVSHRQWCERVAAFVRAPQGTPPVLGSRDCRLGQWYYRSGMRRYAQLPEFQALEAIHEEFHASANQLLKQAENGDPHAEARLPDLLRQRDAVLKMLERFIERPQSI